VRRTQSRRAIKKKTEHDEDNDDTDEGGNKKEGEDKKKDEEENEDLDEDLDVGGGAVEKPEKQAGKPVIEEESTKKNKWRRSNDSDSDDDLTPAQLKEKRKKERKYRQEKSALSWANEAPEMAKFLELPYANIDLSCPETDPERALKIKVDTLWVKLGLLQNFLPKHNLATWNNMPYMAKVAGWNELRRLKIPWNVFEYNDKAQSKLAR
jgi:hypothetical protein